MTEAHDSLTAERPANASGVAVRLEAVRKTFGEIVAVEYLSARLSGSSGQLTTR